MVASKVSNNKRIAKNTLFLYFRTFLVMLVTLYMSRVVLHALGEADYGIYNLVGGIVVFFSFMNTAMSAAVQRYLNFHLGRGEEQEAGRVFGMSLVTHLMLTAGVLVLGETVGLWFVQTQLNIPPERSTAVFWVYQTSLLCCCVNIVRIPYNAAIIAYERMDFYAYVGIAEVVLKLGVAFLLLAIPLDALEVYSFLILSVGVAVFLIYKTYCNRSFDTTRARWFWDRELFAKLFSFSGWSLAGCVANTSVSQGFSIFLNLFYGVAANAALGLSHQIQSALVAFISSFQTAFSPQIVKTYAANEREAFVDLVSRSSRLSYCLVFVFAMPLMACIDPLLRLWLVDVPAYTASFSVIYIVYCMADALSGPLWVSIGATGHIKRYQVEVSALILLNLPLAYLVLRLGGSPVLALGIRAGINVLAYFYRIAFLAKRMAFPGMRYMRETMLPVTLMTLVSVPLLVYMRQFATGLVQSAGVFAALLAVNLLLVAAIGLRKRERELIAGYIRRRI